MNSRSSLWGVAVQLLAATAGVTAFGAFVGAAMFWLRFNALDLADRAVALLPRSDLLTVGAHSLAVPILIGLAAVYIIFLIEPPADRGKPTLRLWITVGAFFVVGLLVLIFSVHSYDIFFEQLIAYGALRFAASLIVLTAIRTTGFAPLGWVVFASFAPARRHTVLSCPGPEDQPGARQDTDVWLSRRLRLLPAR
jgi:hypothetical protein